MFGILYLNLILNYSFIFSNYLVGSGCFHVFPLYHCRCQKRSLFVFNQAVNVDMNFLTLSVYQLIDVSLLT